MSVIHINASSGGGQFKNLKVNGELVSNGSTIEITPGTAIVVKSDADTGYSYRDAGAIAVRTSNGKQDKDEFCGAGPGLDCELKLGNMPNEDIDMVVALFAKDMGFFPCQTGFTPTFSWLAFPDPF